MRGFVLAMLSLAACANEDSVIELGVFAQNFTEAPHVAVPSSVAVGAVLDVAITTFGDGCVSFERTDIEIDGDVIDIAPYDRREIPANGVCLTIGYQFDHGGPVIFQTTGTKLVRVHGRRTDGRIGRPDHEVLELTYDVLVIEPLESHGQ